MADTRDLVQELSLGGKTIDGNSQFFYALIAMACLYGCFIGFGAAITLQANLTALAARRLTGKYIAPKSEHLEKRVEEIHEGKFDDMIEKIMQKSITEMQELYNSREIEK